MNRTEAQTYLTKNFAEFLAQVGNPTQVTTDALDGFESFVATRPDVDSVWHELVAEYFMLRRLQKAFGPNFDVNAGGTRGSYTLSQQFKQVSEMLKDVSTRLGGIVDPVAPGGESGEDIGGLFTITTPYRTGGVW